jgi:hypothetical protein
MIYDAPVPPNNSNKKFTLSGQKLVEEFTVQNII